MKRTTSIILTLVLVTILIYPNVQVYADKDDYYKCIELGEEYGEKLGKDHATEDDRYGRNPDYLRLMPSEEKIKKDYYVEKLFEKDGIKMSDENINVFYFAFKKAYKKSYEEYLKSKDFAENKGEKKEEKADYGKVFGSIMGEIYGYKDYFEGRSSNWLKAIPSNSYIIKEYELNKDPSEYRTQFIKNYREKFKESYEEAYRKAKFEPQKISNEEGLKDGKNFGEILGNTYGKKDYLDDKYNDWKRHLPSDNEIENNYLLNKDNSIYKEGFIKGFKELFEKSYNEGYRQSKVSYENTKKENGLNYGIEIGKKKGESLAQIDFISGLSNNWKRYNMLDIEIISDYGLDKEDREYTQSFISGFREGFISSYIKTFQEMNKENSSTKVETKIIPISGGDISSGDGSIKLDIPKNIFYNDIGVSIDKLSINNNYLKKLYTPASNIYRIKISNELGKCNNKEKILLSFEYYGSNKGGIYKYIKGEWVYIPSKIEDGKIIAEIRPSSMQNIAGTYCVLIDDNFVEYKDLRGHWAKDEINTYVKRKYISGYKNKNFSPNAPIKRGDFLKLLSKVYEWKGVDNYDNIKKFKDYKNFKGYEDVISYSVLKGYMKGYTDNTFRANSPMTYREVENVMKKVTGNKNFKWENTAYRMMYSKDVRCKSFNSKNNHISRGEAIYMLYLINEWKIN